ncbi:MAG TPA: glycosyltransferase family 2 protein [Candidatus Saccharimonadales bacterium]|nr:glycosyltransferase family 2 protein [Candidatus Saccharimonadales bacterium]
MKLVVQIPCLNEEATLPLVLKSIPKEIDGVDDIEILVIDDGSTDKTVEVARSLGVKHFVRHSHRGLGYSFSAGVEYALKRGADIVVNTDGDNQYPQERIADLVQPIVHGQADIVIADRQTHKIAHFSPFKKLLQRFGSYIVNKAAGTTLPDAASGFRAYSKDSLLQLNTVTRFSYCMETIIQAGNKRLKIVSLPVDTNPKTRESRLFKSTFEHVRKSGMAIVRAYIMYKPYVIFGVTGTLLLIVGIVPFARYVYLTFTDRSGSGHLQSLILGMLLLIAAFLCFALNIIADLIRINRTLIEQNLTHTKKIRFVDSHKTTDKS